MLYILFSILQAYGIGSFKDMNIGVDQNVVNPNPKCVKP
jgi:hypothetical protein